MRVESVDVPFARSRGLKPVVREQTPLPHGRGSDSIVGAGDSMLCHCSASRAGAYVPSLGLMPVVRKTLRGHRAVACGADRS